MQDIVNTMSDFLTRDRLLDLGLALLILVGGWIVARLVAWGVARLLRVLDLDQRIAAASGDDAIKVERFAGTLTFYLAMLAVLIAFFEQLGFETITGPLEGLLDQILNALPGIAAAILLFIVAWIVATIVRTLVNRLADMTSIDERLASEADISPDQPLTVSGSLASAAYYLVFLFFLPAILGALNLENVALPVQDLLADLLGFLPNLLGAIITFLIGYYVARVLRQIVSSFLASAGIDAFGARVGLDDSLRISSLAGTIVYALVLIPIAISALDQLAVTAISGPATEMLNTIADSIPGLLAAAAVLLVSWYVGRLVAGLVTNLLAGIGFDRVLGQLGLRQYATATPAGRRPSEIVGYVVLFFIMLFATVSAAGSVGFDQLSSIATEFTTFSGKVVLGAVVLAVGIYFANLLRDVVAGSGIGGEYTATIANIARITVLVLAAITALEQVLPSSELISSILTELVGSIGLAVAVAIGLAFGLGGRRAAADLIARRTGTGGGRV